MVLQGDIFYLSDMFRKRIRFSHSVYWYLLSSQNSSMVERSTCNADVVGSSPASGFDIWCSLVSGAQFADEQSMCYQCLNQVSGLTWWVNVRH